MNNSGKSRILLGVAKLLLKKYWWLVAIIAFAVFVLMLERQQDEGFNEDANKTVGYEERMRQEEAAVPDNTEEPKTEKQITYFRFIEFLKEKKIKNVIIKTGELTVKTSDGKEIIVNFDIALKNDLVNILLKNNVPFYFDSRKDSSQTDSSSSSLLLWILMFAAGTILIMIFSSIFRQVAGGLPKNGGYSEANKKSDQFMKTATRKMSEKPKTTFNDVAGIDEAKEELQETIEFLKNPAKFTRLGGKLPGGVLLIGPPGCGKTLLARAVAGEADVPFFTASGSEFVEMFVGVGAGRVRNLFESAKKEAPCIIFIDELDAMGKIRGAGIGGGTDEHQQTLNQILVEMDGIENNKGVIVLAATNRPDVLDPALLRPGRFDRQVTISRPDVKGREEIFKVHAKSIILKEDINLKKLAQETPGFTGADIKNLTNEAALLATKKNKSSVEMQDFRDSMEKITMGAERKSLLISPREKRIVAIHETGHAMAIYILHEKEPEYTDPLQKVSIIPRPMALGVTAQKSAEDRFLVSENFLKNRIIVLLAGRAAEELILDECTSGAAKDLETATQTVRDMITRLGMNKKIGLTVFGENAEHVFLGKQLSTGFQKNCSEQTAREIDNEISELMRRSYEKAKEIISGNNKSFNKIVKELLEKETLTAEEIAEIIKNKP